MNRLRLSIGKAHRGEWTVSQSGHLRSCRFPQIGLSVRIHSKNSESEAFGGPGYRGVGGSLGEGCPKRNDVDQCVLSSVMSRNLKPEFAVNERTKTKRKPLYIGGLKVPTPGNSSFQCWCVVIFSVVGYHCFFVNFPVATHPYYNLLGIFYLTISLYCLWMTWSTHAGTVPDRGWVRQFQALRPSPYCLDRLAMFLTFMNLLLWLFDRLLPSYRTRTTILW